MMGTEPLLARWSSDWAKTELLIAKTEAPICWASLNAVAEVDFSSSPSRFEDLT